MSYLLLNGNDLTINQIYQFTTDEQLKIRIAQANNQIIQKGHAFLTNAISKQLIYGINTGFGPMANHILGTDLLVDLQTNLIKSHAVGMGAPLEKKYVLAMMLVRLNTLIKGYSGISLELTQHFEKLLNHRIVPLVPEHGSVGASGDLVQLAHIALVLIGEGQVYYKNELKSTPEIFKQLELAPYQLKPKEGLSLINGTASMAGIAALVNYDAQNALNLSIRLGAFALELVSATDDSICTFLQSVRPHRGQQIIAEKLQAILASSKLICSRYQTEQLLPEQGSVHALTKPIQEFYSLRCLPQILGPIMEVIENTHRTIAIEINAVTDNPILNIEEHTIIHGGNFHGDYMALAIDYLKIACTKLVMLTERRINFFLHHKVNLTFPPFLNLHTPGLTLGLQGLQFVATSTAAQCQSLSFPHYLHSIPTNADNQDIVSMGTDAALLAAKVVDNLYILLAIEMITLTQAADCLAIYDKLSQSSKTLYKQLRSIFPKIEHDRVIEQELDLLLQNIRTNTTWHAITDVAENSVEAVAEG